MTSAPVVAKYERKTIAPDGYLFLEGEAGEHAYLIESGMVQILKTAGNAKIALAVVGRGELIGEMALVDQQPRMASAQAIEETIVVIIPREEFLGRLSKLDPVTQKLLVSLVRRVRGLGESVARLKTHVQSD